MVEEKVNKHSLILAWGASDWLFLDAMVHFLNYNIIPYYLLKVRNQYTIVVLDDAAR